MSLFFFYFLTVFSCWSVSLDNVMKKHVEKSTKRWFSVYQMIEKYVQEHTEANMEGKCYPYINMWQSCSNY